MTHIRRPSAVEGDEQLAREMLWETAAKGKLELGKHLISLSRFPKKKMLTAVFARGTQRLTLTTYWTGDSH